MRLFNKKFWQKLVPAAAVIQVELRICYLIGIKRDKMAKKG